MQTSQPLSTALERIFRIDAVRASKLLEITQYSLIVGTGAFYVGSAVDRLFPERTDKSTTADLIKDILLQLALLTVAAYYVRKAAELVPFMFSLTSEYIPSKKGEAVFGASVAMAIVYGTVQPKLARKIGLLKERLEIKF